MAAKKHTDTKLSYTHINLNSQLPTFPDFRKVKNWVYFGNDNNFPQRIINLNNQSAVNKAILDNKVTYICGDGIDDSIDYFGTPNQSDTWDSFIEKVSRDYTMFGGFCFQVCVNQDGTSFSLFHTDFSKVRCGDFNEFGIILNYYISNDWTRINGRTAPVGIKSWGTEQPTKGERYLYYYKDYTAGLDYYPIPSYYSAIDYIEADGLLAKFYRNSISNGFTPSTIITMPANPSDEEKEQFQADMEKNFCGTEGANSFIVLWGESQEVKPVVTAFSASQNADLYNNVNDVIFQKIISAHRLTSPTLAGISGSGNLSGNGAEITNSYILYNYTVIQQLRRNILDTLNQFIIMNGYTGRMKIKELDVISKIAEASTPDPKTDSETNNETNTQK